MIALIGYVALSFALIGAYRWLALRYRWLDQPNHRSSHIVTTPRGAGLIFALIILSAASWQLRNEWTISLSCLTGLIVAFVGWADDVCDVSPRLRFIFYVGSSMIASALILITRADPAISVVHTVIYGTIATLGIVWLINLYNFMDGINGLAVFEAIFVLLSIYFFACDGPYGQIFSDIHLLSCAVLIGFLFWNFPGGKVFMGDSGSVFLGFFLGVLILLSWKLQGPMIAVWFILLAIFISDTGYTLFVRVTTKQKWYEAHRLHAYQRLTTHLRGSHTRSVIVLMIVNLCWLLPIAWFVQTSLLSWIAGLALAYPPLLIACHRLKAGIPQQGDV